VLVAMTFFIAWHTYLVLTNQTTIEFFSNWTDASDARRQGERWVNPYSVGMRDNFEQVFGLSRSHLAWLLPSRKPPPGDGISFPRNASCELADLFAHLRELSETFDSEL